MAGRGRPAPRFPRLSLTQGSLKVRVRADEDIGPYTVSAKTGGILRTNGARPASLHFFYIPS